MYADDEAFGRKPLFALLRSRLSRLDANHKDTVI
jgi:hypothetical protein